MNRDQTNELRVFSPLFPLLQLFRTTTPTTIAPEQTITRETTVRLNLNNPRIGNNGSLFQPPTFPRDLLSPDRPLPPLSLTLFLPSNATWKKLLQTSKISETCITEPLPKLNQTNHNVRFIPTLSFYALF